ncbi:unnamed protein product [Ilex paraguariensis]|uniref:Disease resistance N-terminal domain-containing protein n=1 Tax=Ilex paraguariensis TaxID=185542 RepID=A0ABC8UXQ9_9AQUA
MSEAIVSFVVQTLTDLLKEEAEFLAGVDGQVQGLPHELKMLQSLLKDADARQIEDDPVRTWVEGAREVAYHAEDVLETYVLQVQSKRRGGILNILKRFACLLNEGMLLHKVGKETQGINTRISQLTDQLDKYGIRSTIKEGESSSSAHERQRQLRRSYSHVVEEDFVGLERDVENLVVHLVKEDRGKYDQVVSICGMGDLSYVQKMELGRKMVKHCGGLPLAVVVLGGLLATKEALSESLFGQFRGRF